MTKPENACVVACVSGVVGAVVSALSLNTGLGEQRVVLIVRAAIVLLGFAVAGGLLLLRPTRHRIVWGSVTLSNAFALAAVFGFFGTPPGDLKPSEVLGPQAMLPALVQVLAFGIATFGVPAVTQPPRPPVQPPVDKT